MSKERINWYVSCVKPTAVCSAIIILAPNLLPIYLPVKPSEGNFQESLSLPITS